MQEIAEFTFSKIQFFWICYILSCGNYAYGQFLISTAVRPSNLASYIYIYILYIISAWGVTKGRFQLEVSGYKL